MWSVRRSLGNMTDKGEGNEMEVLKSVESLRTRVTGRGVTPGIEIGLWGSWRWTGTSEEYRGRL